MIRDIRKDSQGVDEPELIELPINHAGMVGITEQVIHPVHTEAITNDEFCKYPFPFVEDAVFELFGSNCQLDYVFGSEWRNHFPPNAHHLVTLDQIDCQALVRPALW